MITLAMNYVSTCFDGSMNLKANQAKVDIGS